jgi:pyrroloquinoline quinone biosynthesis protein E
MKPFVIQRIYKKIILRWPWLTDYRIPVEWIQSIDIEPIARCNLKCPFCQVPGWERAEQTKAMSLENFKKIVDQFPSLAEVKIQGMGEPFINKHMPELISYCSQKQISTYIVSNGTILPKTTQEKIIDAGLNKIWFSFDGATKATYESLRVGANYEHVLNNIRELCITKKERKSKIGIGMVCLVSTDQVMKEIPDYVQMVQGIGVEYVYIKSRLKNWEKKGDQGAFVIGSMKKTNAFEGFYEYYNAGLKIAEKLGVHVSMVEDGDYTALDPCPWPWSSAYISAEGKVVPCCTIGVPETWNMGDLMKQDIREIWNNDAYRKLRREMKENTIRELCQNCYGQCEKAS